MATTAADLHAARERIQDQVLVTPALRSRLLAERAGGPVFLKAESLQRTGSFKFRGALNAVRSLSEPERRRGVTTYSSGNHGQALARAAQIEGLRAVVFMPEDAPAAKVAAARAYGAEVRFAGLLSPERKRAAEEAARDEGLVVIPPFDDPRIVAGQGTVGLEILEQVPGVDVVLVPVGGGGLLAGVSLALEQADAVIHGVEPSAAPGMARALAAGAPVTIEPGPTRADGLKPVRVGDLPFAIVKERVAGVALVGEEAIAEAVRFLATRAKLVVEPSGAVGVAALLEGAIALDGRTAVVGLSGGNGA
jgi:threonine dehydratase